MPETTTLEPRPDTITQEIMERVASLPINKKKALLELLDVVPLPDNGKKSNKKRKGRLSEERKKELLSISAWPEEDIQEIEKAREYINSWTPKSF